MKKVLMITALVILCGAILAPAAVLAETTSSENLKLLSDCLIPKDSMYYEGHTYLAFEGSYTWQEANSLCEKMGGHLVSLENYEEQAAVTELSSLGWTGACAFGEESTREWIWYYSGEVIGIMHEPQLGSEGDQFYYTPRIDLVWDALYNEPNSWKVPWDQCVAVLNERGLNTLMPSDTDSFICEFDSMRVFSIVDINYDLNYQFELEWGRTQAWDEYPANYTDGLLQGVENNFGEIDITPEYPSYKMVLYNFMGYSLYSNNDDTLLDNEDVLHMDSSKWYIGDVELEKPIITLYTVWEKAETKQATSVSSEESLLTPSEKLLPTEVPAIPADISGDISAVNQEVPKSSNPVLPVAGGVAATIAVASISGFALFLGTNLADFKEVMQLLQANPSIQANPSVKGDTVNELAASSDKEMVDIKQTNQLKYMFLYIKLRKYTYIIGQKDAGGSGRMLHKVRLKFKSQSKLSVDLTEDMQNTAYQFYRIRHPKKAMKRKKDISIVYLNNEEIMEQDHFNSISDYVNIKIIEK